MGRKGRICNLLLIIITMMIMDACIISGEDGKSENSALLSLRVSGSSLESRTILPDEDLLCDATILIYDDSGRLEAELEGLEGEIRLASGKHYTILAYANMSRLPAYEMLDDMMNCRYGMDTPYDYESGIPMSCIMQNVLVEKDTELVLRLERLMSKVSIRVDRSELDYGIEMKVRHVIIGNCPADAMVFQESRAENTTDCFDVGFERDDTSPLNMTGTDGISEELSLYMLENMQGSFSTDGPFSESEKVFNDEDARKGICSYIEMQLEYQSDSLFCTEKPLIYRFYIGEGLNDLNVERNSHYHITICPEGDGLSEDIWRIEKKGLHSYVQKILLDKDVLVLDYKGKSEQLKADICPPEAYIKKLLWKSSDPGIVSVDQTGRVEALSEGTAIITCSSTDGSMVWNSCAVENDFAPARFTAYPEDRYINGDIGDTIRLWCDIFPPNTPFDIGVEYLEDDKADGIYDFVIDEDGHGVTLTLTGAGSGLIYMEAGEPVNDAALFFIEVNLPDD